MGTCIVYVDAGHGGRDSGAVNPQLGLRESDIALDMAYHLVNYLNNYYAGVDARLTRAHDVYLTLGERPELANKNEGDLFISLHLNASDNKLATGWEVYTTRGSTRSDRLATCVGEAYEEVFPAQNARKDWSDGDLDKEANYRVISGTDHPSILFEFGFISNDLEARVLVSEAYQLRASKGLAAGIAKFKGLKRKELPSPQETIQPLTREQKLDKMWEYFSENVVK